MEGWAVTNLMIVVLQRVRRILQQRCQPGLAVHQRQSSQVLAIQKQQVEEKEDKRSLAGIGRILDQVEGRPAIRENPAKFTVKVGVLRRKPGY